MRSHIAKSAASRMLSIQFLVSIPACAAAAWMPSDAAPAAVAITLLTAGVACLVIMD